MSCLWERPALSGWVHTSLWLWSPGSVSTGILLTLCLNCSEFIIRLDRFVYLELVLSRKCTHWELRQKHRFQSPLCDWRLGSVIRRQREFGDGHSDVRSHWPRKYSWVSESVSDGDPDVGQEAMAESTLSSWSLSLDEENDNNNAWMVLYDQDSNAIK